MNRFLEGHYTPSASEVVVQYCIVPQEKERFHECLHDLATNLRLAQPPRVFDLDHDEFTCHIAFDERLFETGNIAQSFTVVSNVLNASANISSAQIRHIQWSKKLLTSFPGPARGTHLIREQLKIPERPLSALQILPKGDINIKVCLEKAYLAWMGGCDIVLDSDLLTSLENNAFEERIDYLSKEQKNCSERTKQHKLYIPNITAGDTETLQKRAQIASHAGLNAIAVQGDSTGWTALKSLQRQCSDLGLILCVRSQQTSHISTQALTELYQHLGADMVEISSTREENTSSRRRTSQDHGRTQSLPMLSPKNLPQAETLIKDFGNDVILIGDHIVPKHPDGLKPGAEAFLAAIEAATQGIDQSSAAKKNEALARALAI